MKTYWSRIAWWRTVCSWRSWFACLYTRPIQTPTHRSWSYRRCGCRQTFQGKGWGSRLWQQTFDLKRHIVRRLDVDKSLVWITELMEILIQMKFNFCLFWKYYHHQNRLTCLDKNRILLCAEVRGVTVCRRYSICRHRRVMALYMHSCIVCVDLNIC